MTVEDSYENYFRTCRKEPDAILFDIVRESWQPSYEALEQFCKGLYSKIVDKYKELERTREYVMTCEVLYATDCQHPEHWRLVSVEG